MHQRLRVNHFTHSWIRGFRSALFHFYGTCSPLLRPEELRLLRIDLDLSELDFDATTHSIRDHSRYMRLNVPRTRAGVQRRPRFAEQLRLGGAPNAG